MSPLGRPWVEGLPAGCILLLAQAWPGLSPGVWYVDNEGDVMLRIHNHR